MKLFRKKTDYYIAAGIILLAVLASAFYYFAFTAEGSGCIVRLFFSRYLNSEKVEMKAVRGDFFNTLLFRDIVLDRLAWLPKGSVIKIQELILTSFSPRGVDFEIRNGRFILSEGDIIFFYGKYRGGQMDMAVFSNSVDFSEVSNILPFPSKHLSGIARDIDMNIAGSFAELKLTGRFKIEGLSREGFSVDHCPCAVDLRLKDIKDNLKAYGKILLAGGVVRGPHTAVINLEKGAIAFAGDFKNPYLSLTGTSQVEDVKIHIALGGSFDKPDFKLTSSPPMNQDRLFFMLLTNKTWKNIEEALSKGEMSVGIVSDILNHFIFPASGGGIARSFGLRDISLKYDGRLMGAGVKKDVTEKAQVSYFIQQDLEDENQSVNQKIGASYKISEAVSIGAEKEIEQNNENAVSQDNHKTDDKVVLRFKREF